MVFHSFRAPRGTGICNIYEFLAYKHPHDVDEEVHQLHNERPKDAGLIAMNARLRNSSYRAIMSQGC